MPENKVHHFVSQFYLRNFGRGNSVGLYNIDGHRHIPSAPIPGQCQRPYFYGRDQLVEKKLTGIERAASRVIRTIIETSRLPSIASNDYVALMTFLSYQLCRTPEAVAVMRRTQEKWGDAAANILAALAGGTASQAVLEEIRTRWYAPLPESLKNAEKTTPLFADLQPSLLVNRTATPFITSDMPAVLFNPWCRGWTAGGVTGITCSGLIVILPLSPEHTLLLVDSNVYSTSRDAKGVIDIDPRDIKGLNALRLLGAETNLYYRNAPEAIAAIDDLPFRWRISRVDQVRVKTARSEQDGSYLIMCFQEQPDVKLDLVCLRVKKNKRGVPLKQRAQSWRPAARETARRLGMWERHDDAKVLPGQSWQFVDEP